VCGDSPAALAHQGCEFLPRKYKLHRVGNELSNQSLLFSMIDLRQLPEPNCYYYIGIGERVVEMRNFSKTVSGWFSVDSESGVTAIEYGLIASLIAVAIIVAVTLVGTNLSGLFTYIAGKVVAP
jgi:pilus assembly protein Flp/PilA